MSGVKIVVSSDDIGDPCDLNNYELCDVFTRVFEGDYLFFLSSAVEAIQQIVDESPEITIASAVDLWIKSQQQLLE